MGRTIVVALLCMVAYAAAASKDCSIADVVFIMDESASIWPGPFNQQKAFINDVIKVFNVGKDDTRVGLVRFSTQARLEFSLKAHFEKTELYAAVNRIQQKGGNTNTGGALKVAREQAFSARNGARSGDPNIPKIAIVITDGNSQLEQETKKQAEITRDTGVTIFAIGVGKEISRVELDNIASGPEFVFAVENYDALHSIIAKLEKQACNVAPTLPPQNIASDCRNKKMDLALVIDTSSTVSAENFNEMKSLARAMLYSFQISSAYTRVSVVSYSTGSKVHNYLNNGNDRRQLYDEIDSIRQIPGESNTAGVLKSLSNTVFSPESGARTKVAKVALFITNTKSSDASLASRLAGDLYAQRGVEVFAVLTGSGVDAGDWKALAGNDNVLIVDRYSDLASPGNREDIAGMICYVKPPPQDFACGERNPADIAFVVDTLNAGSNGLSSINSFIRSITGKFEIGPRNIQVSVIENQCHQMDGFALNTHKNKIDLLNALTFSVRSDTVNVLQKLVSETFTTSMGARPESSGAKRFAILFVDGTPGSEQEAERAANAAKRDGRIEIFVIGIGEKVDIRVLEKIASSRKHVVMVGSYAQLERDSGLSSRISDVICKQIQ